VLEALRQPLENARVVVSRATGTATYVNDQCPARGLSWIGVRTCLLPVLQGDSQSGGVAPTVSTVGFPDSTVWESRERPRAAIRNAGLAIPGRSP